MSLFNNAIIGASGQGGYRISRSVRLRSSASAYFNRTPASAGNRKTWTWSGWVKRGSLGAAQILLSSDVGTSNSTWLEFGFDAADTFTITSYTTDSNTTAAVFRDPSSWYHIVVAFDSTQATSANRCKIYVNGTQQTLTGAGFTLNADYGINNAQAHAIGYRNWSTPGRYFDGYLTEVNFIDGQALTPSSFGETNAVTGVWQPKRYAGTYGTNGFYLNFSDNSNNTATTIGKDYSGNGNNWTPNNISVTAGVTYDSMLDVPTLTDANTANYCVLNPLNNTGTTASANLNWNGTDKAILSTIAFPTTGKYYFEATCSTVANFSIIGIANSAIYASAFNGVISSANFRTYNSGGEKADSTRTASWGSTFTNNDIIGVAVDMDNGAIYFAKNNTWQASGVPTSGASKTGAAFTDLTSSGLTWTPFFGATNINGVWIANFGQRPFTYTPPTGFVALNTQNLPTPTISNGASYMAATTYTGTGSALTIANTVGSASFQPDLVWVKGRSGATDHALYDAVRGVQKQLESNTTTAETTETTGLTAFGSTGFTVGALAQMNTNTATYVAWQWNAGGSTVTNTSGTISSQVRANATAGFSVVTYTGTGANATVGHGLGVAPSMIIIKVRSTTNSWVVYHQSLGNTKAIYLNLTGAADTNASFWNNTSPTSSVFTVNTDSISNANGATYVAYCFAAVAGYSAFGSYTGNGSTDGPFVFLGFRPRWFLAKLTSSAGGSWHLIDTSRSPTNEVGLGLYPNTSGAESSDFASDILSNGLKIRNTQAELNASGATYIYAAFAEVPFKVANAR